MTDEIRAEITNAAKAFCHYSAGPHAANSCCSGIGRCEMGAAIEEITRLRAERDALMAKAAQLEAGLRLFAGRTTRERTYVGYRIVEAPEAAIARATLEGKP